MRSSKKREIYYSDSDSDDDLPLDTKTTNIPDLCYLDDSQYDVNHISLPDIHLDSQDFKEESIDEASEEVQSEASDEDSDGSNIKDELITANIEDSAVDKTNLDGFNVRNVDDHGVDKTNTDNLNIRNKTSLDDLDVNNPFKNLFDNEADYSSEGSDSGSDNIGHETDKDLPLFITDDSVLTDGDFFRAKERERLRELDRTETEDFIQRFSSSQVNDTNIKPEINSYDVEFKGNKRSSFCITEESDIEDNNIIPSYNVDKLTDEKGSPFLHTDKENNPEDNKERARNGILNSDVEDIYEGLG
eukprot:GHVP01002918.1.p2 GENE.GHVP01002918.1~~GHVP01002918.1.p2  ORF type:complete len:302 (+),score=58.94 GHVP01002918.1:1705-2610(+)